jgi:hypothetical protein
VPGAKEPQRTARVDFRIFCGVSVEPRISAISPEMDGNTKENESVNYSWALPKSHVRV